MLDNINKFFPFLNVFRDIKIQEPLLWASENFFILLPILNEMVFAFRLDLY
jgi:hypothetical protein